jgi:quinol-cytochrome oxidoreductase complex cytochrome b subunit
VRLIAAVAEWVDRRLQLAAPIRDAVEHRVPRNAASWWYVFGSAALVVFALQVVTGILLAMVYVPSAEEAWSSLQALNHQVAFGWFVRALHGWGSNFMIAVVLIHMMQVFLFGAYKYPRELTWIIGVFLLLTTLGMAFTGQIMRFDQDAYWGLGIGASISSRVPVVGPAFVPYVIWKDLVFAGFILFAVGACAWYFGPFGPTGRPDPTIIQTTPRPDYFFLWLYALLSLLPAWLETPALLIGPPVAIVLLLLLPFVSGEVRRAGSADPLRC